MDKVNHIVHYRSDFDPWLCARFTCEYEHDIVPLMDVDNLFHTDSAILTIFSRTKELPYKLSIIFGLDSIGESETYPEHPYFVEVSYPYINYLTRKKITVGYLITHL